MKNVKFSILGYPADQRVNNLIRFLTEHGGAIYKSKLSPGDIDLIVVFITTDEVNIQINSSFLHRLVEVPRLVECKLDPAVKIVRGIEYLENCCKIKNFVDPTPQGKNQFH